MNKIEIVKAINSPYANLKKICDVCGSEINIGELEGFDLEKLIPKVIDDDAIGVYEYLDNGNLYLVDEDGITQVTPTHILFEEDGYLDLEEDELFEKYECTFAGEADDMSCYVYFE